MEAIQNGNHIWPKRFIKGEAPADVMEQRLKPESGSVVNRCTVPFTKEDLTMLEAAQTRSTS